MPETKAWTARAAGVIGLGLLFLACSSSTVGTGPSGDDDDEDGGADAGVVSGNDAAAGDDATAPGDGDGDDASTSDSSTGGGDDAARRDDAGPCAPVAPPTTYTFHEPVNVGSVCTADQVTDYVSKCGSEATTASCDTFRNANANAQCYACLLTPLTATHWGAIVQNADGIQSVNEAGCIVTLDSSASARDCALNGESLTLCTAAACDQACYDSSTSDEFDCEQEAENGACSQYLAAVMTCAGQLSASVSSSCTGTTFDESVQNIATVLCVASD